MPARCDVILGSTRLYLDETTLRELKTRELSVAQRTGFSTSRLCLVVQRQPYARAREKQSRKSSFVRDDRQWRLLQAASLRDRRVVRGRRFFRSLT